MEVMGQSIEVSFNYKINVPSEWRSEWPCSRLAGKEINVTINNVGEVENWFITAGAYTTNLDMELDANDVEGAELDAVLGKFSPEDVKKQVNLITRGDE
tara:strand:+ start:559 stop:855 length:297 start_codon:yes stop_codon:yes gene_type:complete